MKPETPARDIMLTGQWSGAELYSISCDCHSPDHAVDMWIEVKSDTETQHVEVEFMVNMSMPFWESSFSRIKAAWGALFQGNYTQTHTLLLNKQAALNLSEAIKASMTRLEHNESQDRQV